jgi:hypothetical protein
MSSARWNVRKRIESKDAMVNRTCCFIASIVAARARSINRLATKSGFAGTDGGYVCRNRRR